MEQTPLESGNEAEARLLESALKIFSEKGYEGTSIREIIEGAGVTRPVLYYYFQNKEDLFRRLVEPLFNEFITGLDQVPGQYADCLGRLKAVMRMTFDYSEQYPLTIRLVFQMYFSPPQCGPKLDKSAFRRKRFQVVERIVREGLEQGDLAGGDAQSLALVFVGIMDTHIMAKGQMPGIRLTTELAEGLVDLFYYGACFKEIPMTALVSPFRYV